MTENMVPIKKENHADSMLSCCSDGDYYPYGTSLSVDDDLIDDLGISELIVEDVVEIRAVGFIDSKHENSRSGGENSKSMRIQITGMKIKRKPEEDDVAKQLYKG